MHGMVKRFDRLVAVGGADLVVASGEVHAVVGENGAGKTTLMQMLAGLIRPDAGHIEIHGRRAHIRTVEDAYALRIAMVHQHFMLFPSFTVTENVAIGREPVKRGLFDRRSAEASVAALAERYGLDVNPRALIADLSVGELQRVEILRALFRGAQILILDEPTGVLTPQETKGLFRIIRDLSADGKTTVFISHKLEEVLEISSSVTVLRDGRVTGVLQTAGTNSRELARLMVGREVFLEFEREEVQPGEPVMEARGLSGAGVHNVDLTLHAGEIVGVAGVAGNGQSQVAELIAGLLQPTSGSVRMCGRDVTRASVADRRAAGLAYIPEDRYGHGLADGASIWENLLMGVHGRPPASRRGMIDREAALERARTLVDRFQVKVSAVTDSTKTLSGGNAQKVVVARELSEQKPLILACQPTRGIDVASTEFVRNELLEQRRQGSGVLLVSADLSEIMSLSDRIVVMYGGEIIGEVDGNEADEIRLGLLMAGLREGPSSKEPASA
jgi:simple sugar transport system ATP-binding protein